MLPYLDDFLLHLQAANYSARTVYNYERDLHVFDSFLVESRFEFARITKREVTYYKAYLSSGDRQTATGDPGVVTSLDARSINRMLSALRSYLKYLIDMDLPCPLPPDAVSLTKAIRKHPQVAELNALTALVESPSRFESDHRIAARNRAMLEVLLATGMPIECAHSSIRISMGRQTTMDEVSYVLDTLPTVIEKVRSMSTAYKPGRS